MTLLNIRRVPAEQPLRIVIDPTVESKDDAD